MPIRIACSCGKTSSVPDAFAGKRVQCAGCQKKIDVPPMVAASTASAKVASDDLSGLFELEGIKTLTGPSCPSCGSEIRRGAVLCTSCGVILQTGERLTSHEQAKSQAATLGHYQLDEAVESMKNDAAMQSRTLNAGMPWWFLLILLVFLGAFAFGLVSIVNAATMGEEATGVAAFLKRLATYPAAVWGSMFGGLAVLVIMSITMIVLRLLERRSHPLLGLFAALGFFASMTGVGLLIVQKIG